MPKTKPSIDEIVASRKGAAVETENGLTLTKAFRSPTSFKSAGGERMATFTMSTEEEDRYGDIVRQAGIDMTEFLKNPIALWGHSHYNTPLGVWEDVKTVNGRPKRTEGTLKFADEGEFEDVDKIARLVQLGIYRACSIGFMAIDYDIITDESGHWKGLDFIASELTECSVVAVGANAGALVKAAVMDKKFVVDELEDILDNWAKTADGLIVPRDQFEKVYGEITAKTISTPELRDVAVSIPSEENPEEEKQVKTISVKLDLSDAEKQADGLAERIAKGIKKALGISEPTPPAPPEYVDGALEEAKALLEAADKKLADTDPLKQS